MTYPTETARATLPADRAPRRAPPATLALGALLVAVAAAGCLPTGIRGEGSGPADSGRSAPPPATAPPAPGSPTPRPPIIPPTPTPEPTFLVYVVTPGDNLNAIAHRYRTTARSIAFWNRSTYPSLDPESAHYRPDLLKIGWTLFVRPNDVVDEQNLPDPSASATDDPGASPSDAPADVPTDAPSESVTPA